MAAELIRVTWSLQGSKRIMLHTLLKGRHVSYIGVSGPYSLHQTLSVSTRLFLVTIGCGGGGGGGSSSSQETN